MKILCNANKVVGYAHRRGLRRLMPTDGFVELNGVKVRRKRLGDDLLPANWVPQPRDKQADYESAIVQALERHVQPGHYVVIVGGGFGVSAVTAAQLVGSTGHVTVYEGDNRAYRRCRRTLSINDCEGRVTLKKRIVGKAVALNGDAMPADRLPECDVLELDCEGAELDILNSITFAPTSVIVESHGFLGASSSAVAEALETKGYRIESQEIAEPSMEDFCHDNDIVVITAKK
jgi:hypothetical protein